MGDETERDDKILDAIIDLKQSIFSLINSRLDNFKNEILNILNENLKLIRFENESEFKKVYDKLEEHEKILDEHTTKIKNLEINTDKEIKALFWRLIKVGIVVLSVNTIIIILAVKFIK